MGTPELLAPAGNFEKLRTAVLYGADAVYLGGQNFGLRAASENFTDQELDAAIKFAHDRNCKVFVTLNSFFHQKDLETLPEFLQYLEALGADAAIVSDLAAVKLITRTSRIPVHLSTQASCNNSQAASFWKDQGVQRIVLGREVSLYEAQSIKEKSGLEIEMFVHGSMCMSYSGNCVISNYTQGRDSNRGGCAHSCRFEYQIEDPSTKQKKNSFFMSSKDLNGIGVLSQYIEAGIDSLKIEGRMKSYHYTGTISKVYREALDYYSLHNSFSKSPREYWDRELEKVSHRSYSEANLLLPAGPDTVYDEREHVDNESQVLGRILEVHSDFLLIEVRSAFEIGDTLELVPFIGAGESVLLTSIKSVLDLEVKRTRPGTTVKIPLIPGAAPYNLLRGLS
ncbi:MAG: U32 family peptidase [Halobacteriovoraceae bacterium]|jgi:U32 family peptidase|nr:U32 family peptidase [Halobacteriovoraceae bacterium]MBT5094343.1 U32 family peptidase [Halobacteriovoraceae bacterium]